MAYDLQDTKKKELDIESRSFCRGESLISKGPMRAHTLSYDTKARDGKLLSLPNSPKAATDSVCWASAGSAG